jgi:ankyrin repeat protein
VKLRKKGTPEILQARYKTWSSSEFEKDGELELLHLSPLEESQRADDPVIITLSEPPHLIYPDNASDYILISATRIGRKNLKYDGFKFGREDAPDVRELLDEAPKAAAGTHVASALFESVRLNNYNLAEHLLKENTSPDSADENGYTALMLAVMLGNKEMVSMLLSAGADVNLQTTHGDTALIHSCRYMDSMLVSIILANDQDLNGRRTNLLWDVWHGSADYIDPFENHPGFSEINVPHACEEKHEIIKLLISSGADLNRQNTQGSTALMQAASNRLYRSLQLLLDDGADANTTDNDGKTALDLARIHQNKKVIEMLEGRKDIP